MLKKIEGLYGKGKKREYWVDVGIGGFKRNLKIHSVIINVAIIFVEGFCLWEEVGARNCWYSREIS